jgi:hypothetical protein
MAANCSRRPLAGRFHIVEIALTLDCPQFDLRQAIGSNDPLLRGHDLEGERVNVIS